MAAQRGEGLRKEGWQEEGVSLMQERIWSVALRWRYTTLFELSITVTRRGSAGPADAGQGVLPWPGA